jgi:tRNA A-37 threonylcarbamoyl transferase component Bud32
MKIGKFPVIELESANLRRVNSLCPLSSVKLEKEVQQHQFEGEVWGSFMLEKLEPSGRIHFGDILKTLFDLHQCKVVHGDPRKQNFLKVPGNFEKKYKWVDFSWSKFDATPADIALDLYICLKGLLVEHPGVVDKYRDEIMKYGEIPVRNVASTLFGRILVENCIKLKY